MSNQPRITIADLKTWVASVLHAAGLQAGHARDVADVLVWADMRGVGSHGVARLPMYVELLATGQMNGSASIQKRLSLPAVVVLEGDRCAGAAGMKAAVAEAVTAARKAGMGMCLLRDTTHTGSLGYYTEMVTESNMIGISGAASGPNMAYHNASTAGVSTAPLSIAAPRGDREPLLFDMASGAVALGKLQQAKATGAQIPAGWAIDALGRPTTDPAEAKTPLPLGGPKGSGLALMLEALTSLLVGNPILAPSLALPPGRRRHYQNAFIIALDVAQIAEADLYLSEIESLSGAMKCLPAVDGQEVLLPGERGFRCSELAREQGIGLPISTLRALEDIAQRFGVTWQGTAG